ncbi:hypothetical protein [Tautonia rosea]|uniref:hypothetical protein n=1 Tax=Tautonia rosea TaxID=2728037 RepID=UPI0014741195|nr:hypothetical protein [Tautonia rosea]
MSIPRLGVIPRGDEHDSQPAEAVDCLVDDLNSPRRLVGSFLSEIDDAADVGRAIERDQEPVVLVEVRPAGGFDEGSLPTRFEARAKDIGIPEDLVAQG